MTQRIGPVTLAAVRYTRDHEGCTKLAIAEEIGPHNSRQYGYAAVNRAMNAGLIENRSETRNRYALYVTAAGLALLAGTDANAHGTPATWRYDTERGAWALRSDDREYGTVRRVETLRAEGTVVRWVPADADGIDLNNGYHFPHSGWAQVEEHAGLLGRVQYQH